jgi:16S rRNA (uracil1498-N3)-methyltransferase
VSAPRVYVPELAEAAATVGALCPLPDAEAHHVTRVMRLATGDPLILFNGRGVSWDAELAERSARHVSARITRARAIPAAAPARLTLAVGLLKGDAMDDVVRDATALGVAEIVPMLTAHVVVPKRARGDEAVARWHRVAVASAKQCGQTRLPVIAAVTAFEDVLRVPGTKLLCVEPALGGADLTAMASDEVAILIGPEGGWSAEDVVAARAAGCHAITLGPLTLRAELAPVVAITRVWSALST